MPEPSPTDLTRLLSRERERLLDDTSGTPHEGVVHPTDDPTEPFALAAVTVDGELAASDDADLEVTIQSVVKPWIYAVALAEHGSAVHDRIGVEPTGEPFDALVLESATGRPPNPMVNAGALMASAMVSDGGVADGVRRVLEVCSAAAGRELVVDERSAETEIPAADRNRALGFLMKDGGLLPGPVEDAVEVLARCCSLLVTARDLAAMAATLATWGRQPVTGERVLAPEVVCEVLSVMASCGMYDGAGRWGHRVGMPAKSGISGTVIAVAPGRLGLASISAPLNERGNSVRGIAALESIAEELGLHRYAPPA